MATLYKLTLEDDSSVNPDANGDPVVWTAISTHTPDLSTSTDEPLCTASWIHAYDSARMAHFMNPAHVNLDTYHIWEGTGTVIKSKAQVIRGVRSLSTTSQLVLTFPTDLQRQKFAILAALEVYWTEDFGAWSHAWLINDNRTAAYATTTAEGILAGLLTTLNRALGLVDRAVVMCKAAAQEVADAAAINAVTYAQRAGAQAHAIVGGGASYEQALNTVSDALERARFAAERAEDVATTDRQRTLTNLALDSLKEAEVSLATPAGAASAILSARCAAATDSSTIAAYAASAAVMAGESADRAAGGITINFIAVADAAFV